MGGSGILDRLKAAASPRPAPASEVIADHLNEAVNDELQAIFVAVPKTGTTSVRTQIRPEGIKWVPMPHLDICQIRDLFYPFELYRSLRQTLTYPKVMDNSDAMVRERARQRYDSYFKFSSVRNPWARAASLYFRKEGVEVSGRMSFEEFIREHHMASDTCRQPTDHRFQLDWLTDEAGNLAVDYVYKVEEFAEAIEEVRERSNGRVVLENRHANRNPSSRSADYRELYSDEARKLVAQRFEKDIDTFKYTF